MTSPTEYWTSGFHKLTGDTVVEVIDFPGPDLVVVEFASGVRRELSRSIVTVYVSRFASPHRCTEGTTTRHLVKGSAIADLPVTGAAVDRLVGAVEFEAAWSKVVRVGGREHNDALLSELRDRVQASEAKGAQGMAVVAKQLAADITTGLWKP